MDVVEKLREIPGTEKKINQYKMAEGMVELRDNPAMQRLIESVETNIRIINDKLLSGDKMTEQERDLLLCDRERCEWFLYIFVGAESAIKKIKQYCKKYE